MVNDDVRFHSNKIGNLLRRKTLAVAAGLLVAAGMLAVPTAGNAAEIYSYTGPNYTEFYGPLWNDTENMTISFTLDNALGANYSGAVTPTSFTGSDGIFTVTNTTAYTSTFDIQTDGSGNISAWFIYLAQNDSGSSSNYMQSDFNISVPYVSTSNDQAYYFSECQNAGCEETDAANTFVAPGTWSASEVPEPASLALLGGGLIGLRLVRRRRG